MISKILGALAWCELRACGRSVSKVEANIIKLQSHKCSELSTAPLWYWFRETASFAVILSQDSFLADVPGWLGCGVGAAALVHWHLYLFHYWFLHAAYSSLETSHLNSLKSKNWLLQCQVSNSAAQLTALESPYQRQKIQHSSADFVLPPYGPGSILLLQSLQAFKCFWPKILLLIWKCLGN